jgi:phage shock protein E
MIANGAVVIDVRTSEEFAGEHLPSATNIPVQELGARLSDVANLVAGDKAKPIVVYCASGGRAGKAKRALEDAGYTNVVNGGGLDDLQDGP